MKTSLRRTQLLSLSLVLPLFAATAASAAAPAAAASPATAPPVSAPPDTAPPADLPTIAPEELTRGQMGHGLTVLAGGEPVRFEAEVIGVMRNVTPGVTYVLAKLSGHGLEETGVAGGMSGSPVFFDGRLAGAVAFAWPFSKEAVAGITPIAAMRQVGAAAAPALPGTVPVGGFAPPPVSLADLAAGKVPADLLARSLERWRPVMAGGAVPGIQWSLAGFGDTSHAFLAESLGAVAPAGEWLGGGSGGGEASAGSAGAVPALVRGGAVAAVLVDGDLRLAATGTVTDFQGDRVLAFGHPFLGLGPIDVPMAAAEVVTVISSQYSSFKVANLGPIVGAFDQDRQAAIAGTLGAEAAMIPLVLTVDGPERREYTMRIARVPQMTPTLIGISALAGLDSATHAMGLQGLDLTARFRLAGHGELVLEQSFDGETAAMSTVSYLMAVAAYLMQNDLAAIGIEAVEVELAQAGRPRTARLVGAHAERSVVRPGDRVVVHLDFGAWRGETFRRRVELTVPEDAPRGAYHLFVGDGPSIDAARLMIERAEPVNIRQALDLLRSLHSRRELRVLGVAAGQGLSVAGEVMPNLPGSVRSLWSAAPTASATPLRLAILQQQGEAMDVPVEGLVRIDLTVERREPLRSAATGGGEAGEAGDGGGASEVDGTEGGEASTTAPAAAERPAGDPATRGATAGAPSSETLAP